MRPLTLAATALALAAFAAQPARADHDSKQWSKSWDIAGTPSVNLVTNDARVRIRRGPAGKVDTQIRYSWRVYGLSSNVHEPKVVLEQSGNTIRIEAKEPSNWVVFGGLETKFEIDVTVPDSCNLTVRTSDGSITCDPLAGHISLESGDGHIRASGLRGSVTLWTSDGGVDADSLEGSLMAHTSDGHLKVAGRFDRLDLHTQDGRLEATVQRGSQVAEAWSIETGDGSMLVKIPRNLQAMLDASSRDGSLRVDLPVTTQGAIRNSSLYGELNGGKVPMRLRSGDGSITLALSE